MKSYFYIGVLLCATSGAIFEINLLIIHGHTVLKVSMMVILLIVGLLISLFSKKGLKMNSIKILAIDVLAILAGIYVASLIINDGTPIFNFNNN